MAGPIFCDEVLAVSCGKFVADAAESVVDEDTLALAGSRRAVLAFAGSGQAGSALADSPCCLAQEFAARVSSVVVTCQLVDESNDLAGLVADGLYLRFQLCLKRRHVLSHRPPIDLELLHDVFLDFANLFMYFVFNITDLRFDLSEFVVECLCITIDVLAVFRVLRYEHVSFEAGRSLPVHKALVGQKQLCFHLVVYGHDSLLNIIVIVCHHGDENVEANDDDQARADHVEDDQGALLVGESWWILAKHDQVALHDGLEEANLWIDERVLADCEDEDEHQEDQQEGGQLDERVHDDSHHGAEARREHSEMEHAARVREEDAQAEDVGARGRRAELHEVDDGVDTNNRNRREVQIVLDIQEVLREAYKVCLR